MGQTQIRLDTEALRLRGILNGPWRPTQFRSDEPAPDEMVDALIWALAEFAGEHDEDRSAFSEAKHPRNPKGSPGGGRFKSIAARVVDALEQHHAGKGDGDPLKEFNREQVRKVAKARGIELKRGASEAEIKKALIDHAAPRKSAATKKAAKAKSPATPRAVDLNDKGAVRAAFTFTDPETGMHTRVQDITKHSPATGPTTEVTVSIHDSAGQRIGQTVQVIHHDPSDGSPPYAQLVVIQLSGKVQGQGFASRFNKQAEDNYRRGGLTQVQLEANFDVGGYAWARAGYNFHASADRDKVAAKFRAAASSGKYSKTDSAKMRALAKNPKALPAQFALIGHRPGDTMWPGKEIMLQSSWAGVKDL